MEKCSFSVEGVSKSFISRDREKVNALEDITFCAPSKKITCVVGPTGSGKSTLLRLLAGLEEPDSGKIQIEPSATIGYLTQTHGLFPWLKVKDNIALPLSVRGINASDIDKAVRDISNILGLSDALNRYPYEISGGMQQRTAIGRLLASEATHWLLDEPFSYLDERTQHRLQRFLREIVQDRGISTLFVTHSIDEAVYLSDRIVVFSSAPGRVVEIIDVDIKHPRDRLLPEYGLLIERVRTLIEAVIKEGE